MLAEPAEALRACSSAHAGHPYDVAVTITAAADGSALGNPGPAGWAWYVDDDRWAAGGWPHGTNNMGELKAVLELFRATAGVDDDLLVLCDSQYVINSIVKWMPGWKRKGWRKADGAPVMNVELMREIDAVLEGRRYRFEWVKGHVGHELNEAADERARGAATAYQLRSPVDAGPGFTPLTASVARPATVAPLRRLTLELSEAEWRALEARAQAEAVTPEALLRALAAGGR